MMCVMGNVNNIQVSINTIDDKLLVKLLNSIVSPEPLYPRNGHELLG